MKDVNMNKNETFCAFLKDLIKDESLLESITEGFKTIYEDEEGIEEGLRETLGAGLLGTALALAPAARAGDINPVNEKEVSQPAKFRTDVDKKAQSIVISAVSKTVKKAQNELLEKGDPDEVNEFVDVAKQEYMEIKAKLGENWANSFLRSVNRKLIESGISQIKI
jgi:hypothetical protein